MENVFMQEYVAMGDVESEAILDRVLRARAEWPGVPLEVAAFERHLKAHAFEGELPAIDRAGDLWIACACAEGTKGAAAAFEKAFRGPIERAVAQVDRSVVDEVTQLVMVSLLVRDGETRPRIADYGGRAGLRTWLATVATRAALKSRRRKGDQGHESLTGLAEAFVEAAPELAIAKANYGPELDVALRQALESLEPRARVLLRLHHAKGWSIDRLGVLYKVGRSTAARWVSAARESLLAETKRVLVARLGLTPSELESLVAVLQSQLDVSLVRLLDRSLSQAG
jgi:RNA polymerase sigma-70 factor (ECF subfamily)